MRFRIFTGCILLCLFMQVSGQEAPRNILTGSISRKALSGELISRKDYLPLPKPGDTRWLTLDKTIRDTIIRHAERYLDYDWPSLLATRYMDFDTDGNRSRYASRYYGRRNALASLVMAEILENQGRFLPDIVNGIWLICEETTWVVPAHSGENKLHSYDNYYVDLFSAETGALLAWTSYFLGDRLTMITPLIGERIARELDRRILTSMLEHKDFWYMGYGDRIPNNWNPWIVSNWLSVVLLMQEGPERAESVWKAMEILDNFLNPYPGDGGCDEGPGYWGRAAASLFDCLDQLQQVSGGAIDVYDEPLVRNMGRYVYRVHIDGHWYVNFADGSPRKRHAPELIYRYGKAIDDRNMMGFGCYLYNLENAGRIRIPGHSSLGLRYIPGLFIREEMEPCNIPYEPVSQYYFPDLEVMVAREHEQAEGFYTAIKGGFNDESHNHNDAGSFVIYHNGLPLFIDAGVGTYTAKTFSADRYTIWTMQSAYHNLPTINGEMQQYGSRFCARNMEYRESRSRVSLSMDIAGAYGQEARVKSWQREFILDRRRSQVRILDQYAHDTLLVVPQWHFMLLYPPEKNQDGSLTLSNGSSTFLLTTAPPLQPEIEKINLKDRKLRSEWGDVIYRVTYRHTEAELTDSVQFILKETP